MSQRISEVHPSSLSARLTRSLRGLSRLRGWGRLANVIAPMQDGAFIISNKHGIFAGNLSSFIDRQLYIHGGYEDAMIDRFLDAVPPDRRHTILDIGANVGTHTVAFARHFGNVHSFEPNAAVWRSFERNVALNELTNVTLHKIGLSDQNADVPFYSIASTNYGLGTCSSADQYDKPIQQIGTVRMRIGDAYLASRAVVDRIDAIKIDVEGHEAEVLEGLSETIKRDRPYLWIEVQSQASGARALRAIDYPTKLLKFERYGAITHRFALKEADRSHFTPGDYVLVLRPFDQAAAG